MLEDKDLIDALTRLESKVDQLLVLEKSVNVPQKRKCYLEVDDITYICSVTSGCVYNWVGSGKIESVKINGRLRFEFEKVLEFITNENIGNSSYRKAIERLNELNS